MRDALRTVVTGLFVAIVGSGLTFGTVQALDANAGAANPVATEAASVCGDADHELGFCEDNNWTNNECRAACLDDGYAGGGCLPWDGTSKNCCVCIV